MKNIYILIGLVAVFVNSLIGVIFKSYGTFNWLTADAVIILNVVLLKILSNSKINDGFRVAYNFILPILGFVTFILSMRLENQVENNLFLTIIIVLISLQVILLFLSAAIKNDIK